MGRGFSLPAEDRSPADGELFSVEDLYLTQTEEFRREYGHSMAVVFARERRLLQELHDEAEDLSITRPIPGLAARRADAPPSAPADESPSDPGVTPEEPPREGR